jgi:predicted Zn-ribbon and HTH transcriptional regulator
MIDGSHGTSLMKELQKLKPMELLRRCKKCGFETHDIAQVGCPKCHDELLNRPKVK